MSTVFLSAWRDFWEHEKNQGLAAFLIRMISKNKIKYIRSLAHKKKRREEGLFVAEGSKLVSDLLGHFHCVFLAGTAEWWAKQEAGVGDILPGRKRTLPSAGFLVSEISDEVAVVTPEELERASFQQHPQDVLALFRQPDCEVDRMVPARTLCLALDEIQDPGNLGTIIRLADWFGIEHVFCSPGTVDVYNPKVVQATMGALARVEVHYLSLTELIRGLNASGEKIPVYGTFLEGENLYDLPLSQNGLVVMGNEGNGVSPEVAALVSQKLYIPNYPAGRATSESLNVAIATSIVCSEFRRRG